METPPTIIFDLMKEMSGAEFRFIICLYACLKDGETKVELSLRKIAEITGMSLSTTQRGAELAQSRGLIKRQVSRAHINEWTVSTIDTASVSTIDTLVEKGVSTTDTSIYTDISSKRLRTNTTFKPSHPQDVTELWNEFVELSGLEPIDRSDQAFWIKALRVMVTRGITASELSLAFTKLQRGGMTITSPQSLLKTVLALHAQGTRSRRTPPHSASY